MASTKDPNVFTIALHNLGQRGLSVVLGNACTGTVLAVRYRLNSVGVDIGFVEDGPPCAGNIGPLIADLPPGGSYAYDLDHTTLRWDDALMRAVTAGKCLYMLQALLDGQRGIESNDLGKDLPKGVGKYTLWRGKAASACVPFPSPDSPDWRGVVARGGSLGNMMCQAE